MTDLGGGCQSPHPQHFSVACTVTIPAGVPFRLCFLAILNRAFRNHAHQLLRAHRAAQTPPSATFKPHFQTLPHLRDLRLHSQQLHHSAWVNWMHNGRHVQPHQLRLIQLVRVTCTRIVFRLFSRACRHSAARKAYHLIVEVRYRDDQREFPSKHRTASGGNRQIVGHMGSQ